MQNFKLWEMDCWDGYKKVGTKIGKNGQTVNNCVKEDDFVPHMMYDVFCSEFCESSPSHLYDEI